MYYKQKVESEKNSFLIKLFFDYTFKLLKSYFNLGRNSF